jgi:hypothetical protein
MFVHIFSDYCTKGLILYLDMCLSYIMEVTRNQIQFLVVIKCCMPCFT